MFAVRGEGDAAHRGFVTFEVPHLLAADRVPEAQHLVGAAGEDVLAVRSKGTVVGALVRQAMQFLTGGCVPQPARRDATRQQSRAVRGEGDEVDFAQVPLQFLHFLAGLDVPEVRNLVTGERQQDALAVGCGGQLRYDGRQFLEPAHDLAALRLPEAEPVFAAAEDEFAVGGEDGAAHVAEA